MTDKVEHIISQNKPLVTRLTVQTTGDYSVLIPEFIQRTLTEKGFCFYMKYKTRQSLNLCTCTTHFTNKGNYD